MPIKSTYFAVTMDAAATLTSGVDLGRTWDTVSLEVPAMASASNFYVHAAVKLDGTYRRVNVAGTDYTVASGVTNRIIPIPADYQFLKIEASTLNSLALGFNIICKD